MIKDVEFWCEKFTDNSSLLVCRIILRNGEDYFGDCEFNIHEVQEPLIGNKYLNMCISTAKEEALKQVGKALYSDYIRKYRFLGL